jgi:hypothetical protein
MVPKNLNEEKKLERKEICSDILEKVKEDGDFLHSVVTCS